MKKLEAAINAALDDSDSIGDICAELREEHGLEVTLVLEVTIKPIRQPEKLRIEYASQPSLADLTTDLEKLAALEDKRPESFPSSN